MMSLAFAAETLGAPPDFAREVRPILAARCFACHGPDEATREAGLRLDIQEESRRELDEGVVAIAPGDPARSELMARISAQHASDRMPPVKSGPPLTEREVAILSAWIESGAVYSAHWAFAPPQAREPPEDATRWAQRDLDRFVLARLTATNLEPNPAADPRALIRRAALDLTGLPPPEALVHSYLASPTREAFERAVDALLASPAYGERWARPWLDLARYADTRGYEADRSRTIWPWRDWVVRALNADMPYDEFSIRQLAGDLLPGATDDDRLATAFHRNTMNNDEGGTDDEEFRVAAIVDRVNTTMQIWTGLTFNCAQCHSHKYDPISHHEYYGLFAFFNTTADRDQPDESPVMRWRRDEDATFSHELDNEEASLARLEASLHREEPHQATELRADGTSPVDFARPGVAQAIAEQLAILAARRAKLDERAVAVPILAELPAATDAPARITRRFERGSFLSPKEEVSPHTPAILPPMDPALPRNRLGLAKWLLSPDQPLAARVHVNRIWETLFGVGLVETAEDFGTQGALPSDPALLDHLALRFIALGWSQKALLREIVLSATWAQSAHWRGDAAEVDPANRLLWRGSRIRLEAEIVRDQALAAAGLLNPVVGGPPVFPPQPEGVWASVYSDEAWQTSPAPDRHRRSIYTFWKRTSPYPSSISFDAPSREFCVVRRIRTNTPLQALITLNDPAFLEAAAALARRMIGDRHRGDARSIAEGMRAVLVREPTDEERVILTRLLESERAKYRSDVPEARALLTASLIDHAALSDSDAAELAAWSIVASTLLNLDEALTRP